MKKLLLCIATVFLLTACSKSFDPADAYQNMSEQEIYQTGTAELADENYRDAIQYYETLGARYPFGKYAENSQLNVVYAYYKNGDYATAVSAAESYIHLYPQAKHVDYAYYMMGLINFSRGHNWTRRFLPIDASKRDLTYVRQSFINFDDLIKRFPHSQYATDAQRHMIYIRDLLAQHELHIAEFYFERNSYVASANRAGYVVRHFQGAPAVVPALNMLAQSYEKLGKTKAAQETYHILQTNYPST